MGEEEMRIKMYYLHVLTLHDECSHYALQVCTNKILNLKKVRKMRPSCAEVKLSLILVILLTVSDICHKGS